MLFFGGSLQNVLGNNPPEHLTVREYLKLASHHAFPEPPENFLRWAEANGDSPEYFERVFRMVGAIGVTARSIWMAFIRAVMAGDTEAVKKIIEDFLTQEDTLFRACDQIYQPQLEEVVSFARANNKQARVYELAAGMGQFTHRWARQTLEAGALYTAGDESPQAVADNRLRLKALGFSQKETEEIVQLRDVTDPTSFINEQDVNLIIDIRFDLHVTVLRTWMNFMREAGRLSHRLLHAETLADHLPPKRVCNKGTVFYRQKDVTTTLGMKLIRSGVCWHHGDPVVVSDYCK